MPPTITVHYNPTGGALSALVRSGFANPGSYALTLLESGATTIVQQWKADFGTIAQNTHTLGAASAQNGRVLDVIASVGLIDPSKAYSVFLTVIQDGVELGTVSETGTGTGTTKLVELIVMLSGATATASLGASLAKSGKKSGKSLKKSARKKLASRATRRSEVKQRAKKAVAKATAKVTAKPGRATRTRGGKS